VGFTRSIKLLGHCWGRGRGRGNPGKRASCILRQIMPKAEANPPFPGLYSLGLIPDAVEIFEHYVPYIFAYLCCVGEEVWLTFTELVCCATVKLLLPVSTEKQRASGG
jgi:hypothetical protein